MPPEFPKQEAQDAALERQTLRNRTNQRNFRSRRQIYVKELEAQIQAYQAAEIQATKEVQKAARAVAAENYLLRELLKSHLGRTDRDIDMLLVHMRGDHSRSHAQTSKKSSSRNHSETSPLDGPTISPHRCQSANARASSCTVPSTAKINPVPIASAPQIRGTLTVEPPVQHASVKNLTLKHNVTSRIVEDVVPETAASGPKDTDNRPLYNLPSTTTKQTIPQNVPRTCNPPGNSISCEEAASIIANLRLQHIDDVRGELGCTNTASCSIQNVALLQIMTETF